MAELQNSMPLGWDCKLDENSGKYYYINHYTKTTTWEDPRYRHRPSHTNRKPIPTEHIPLQDMKPKMSPLTVRNAKVQDTSLSSAVDTDETVAKISAMFPTVSETHIRILMKNCRYMKSIFPNADETVILEILQNNENNIQKTSESLREMGYSKKDTVKIAQQKMEAKKEEERKDNEKKNTPPSTIQPKIKSAEEKEKLIKDTQAKYKDVAEHLIVIALESVNFDENRADQILQIMIQEDTKVEETKSNIEAAAVRDVLDAPSTSKTYPIPVSQSRQSIKSLLKSEKDIEKVSYTRIIEENDKRYQSQNLSSTTGHNPDYAKGPNENLLLEDYIKWQGGNPNLRKGPQGIACGPNKNFLSKRIFQVCGSNKDLSRGPQIGLAKGSMFGQMKTLVIGESRVK